MLACPASSDTLNRRPVHQRLAQKGVLHPVRARLLEAQRIQAGCARRLGSPSHEALDDQIDPGGRQRRSPCSVTAAFTTAPVSSRRPCATDAPSDRISGAVPGINGSASLSADPLPASAKCLACPSSSSTASSASGTWPLLRSLFVSAQAARDRLQVVVCLHRVRHVTAKHPLSTAPATPAAPAARARPVQNAPRPQAVRRQCRAGLRAPASAHRR